MTQKQKNHKAGFVNIIGKPNVGKSTLMNELVGLKIAITTSKVQTTRHRIRGIVNGDDFQIVYSDTPGIIESHYKLHETMMKEVQSAFLDADIFLYMVDFNDKSADNTTIQKVTQTNKPILLLINKMDLSNQESALKKITEWKKLIPSAEVIAISALHKYNIEAVLETIIKYLPESPPYFPKDQLTDKSERFFVSETIREKILLYYKQEIPYSTEVTVEQFKEDEKIIRIQTIIHANRESQKSILIGHKGVALKRVGTEARKDLERFFNKKIYLELFVKISKNWRDDDAKLKRFGYH